MRGAFPWTYRSTKEECEKNGIEWNSSTWVTIYDAKDNQVASIFMFPSLEENLSWARRICETMNAAHAQGTDNPIKSPGILGGGTLDY